MDGSFKLPDAQQLIPFSFFYRGHGRANPCHSFLTVPSAERLAIREELNTSDLLETPFVRAIMSQTCQGTA